MKMQESVWRKKETLTFTMLLTSKIMLNSMESMVFMNAIYHPSEVIHISTLNHHTYHYQSTCACWALKNSRGYKQEIVHFEK